MLVKLVLYIQHVISCQMNHFDNQFDNYLILALEKVSNVKYLIENKQYCSGTRESIIDNEFYCLDNKGNIIITLRIISCHRIYLHDTVLGFRVECLNQTKTYTDCEDIFPLFSFLALKFDKITRKENDIISNYLINNDYLPKDLCNIVLRYNESSVDIINNFIRPLLEKLERTIYLNGANYVTSTSIYFEMLLDPLTKFVKINNFYSKTRIDKYKMMCKSKFNFGELFRITSLDNEICIHNKHRDMGDLGSSVHSYYINNMSGHDFLKQVNTIVDEIR